MANKIQIKRSVSTAAVSGLANGELAFPRARARGAGGQ